MYVEAIEFHRFFGECYFRGRGGPRVSASSRDICQPSHVLAWFVLETGRQMLGVARVARAKPEKVSFVRECHRSRSSWCIRGSTTTSMRVSCSPAHAGFVHRSYVTIAVHTPDSPPSGGRVTSSNSIFDPWRKLYDGRSDILRGTR